MKPVIAIVGPTATGKSNLALHLAEVIDAEIVSADSCQVYRFMDIGTAKPTTKDLESVPHHMVNILYPDEDFSLAVYQHMANNAIEDIHTRGKPALLVGGSGLYVRSILEGYHIPQVPPDLQYRTMLRKRAEREGNDILYNELMEEDPVAADRIDPRNLRRIIRALEVAKFSEPSHLLSVQSKHSAYDILIIGLTVEREQLYNKIDRRVDKMINDGLIEEVQSLVEKGYSFDLPSMSSLGYRQIGSYLKNEISIIEAIQQMKYNTHRFARHQYAWFKLADKTIKWFDIGEPINKRAENLVQGFLLK